MVDRDANDGIRPGFSQLAQLLRLLRLIEASIGDGRYHGPTSPQLLGDARHLSPGPIRILVESDAHAVLRRPSELHVFVVQADLLTGSRLLAVWPQSRHGAQSDALCAPADDFFHQRRDIGVHGPVRSHV